MLENYNLSKIWFIQNALDSNDLLIGNAEMIDNSGEINKDEFPVLEQPLVPTSKGEDLNIPF